MGVYIGTTELKNAYIGIPFPESIVLDKNSINLTTVGQTEQLTATIEPTISDHSITWSSDDTTVATVSTTGLVACVTPGSCTITATTVNGITATCSVGPGWQPGANTIAYFPFIDDKSNTISGSNISISSSNIGITTVDGVKCLSLNGSATQSLNIGFRTQDITSVMVWIKGGYSGPMIDQRSTSGGDNDRRFFMTSNVIKYERYQSASAHLTGPTISDTNWHCIGITEDSSGAKIFLDGNSAAVTTNSTTRTFPILTGVTGMGCRQNNGTLSSGATGLMGGLVLLNASITIDDFLDYYNKTKSRYGL